MYIYDTHVHTSECSACALNTAREVVRAYKAAGYSGIVLTNHFYRGNSAVDRALPWTDFVTAYYNTYLEAKDEGEKLDFDVIFGLEEGVGHHKEYLLYNIDLEFLLQNPDMIRLSPDELCKRVQAAGGFVSFAHPYRFRQSYMTEYCKPIFGCVDAVEVYNACNEPLENKKALIAAKERGLVFTCGSDLHRINQAEDGNLVGMAFTHRVKDGAEFVAALKDPETKAYIKGEIIEM